MESDDAAIAYVIMRRVKEFNYIATKTEAVYTEALLREYRQEEKENA